MSSPRVSVDTRPNPSGGSDTLDALQKTTLLAQAVPASASVGGIKVQDGASAIKTVTGVEPSGKKALQGVLMMGRTSTGLPLFWLKGTDTNYVLRGANGKPVTNLVDAEARAHELIANGGASRLRALPSAGAGTEFKGPTSSSKILSINLEDPSVNVKGGSGQAVLGLVRRGGPGSALTSGQAVAIAESLGLKVQVTNSNRGGAAAHAHLNAWVQLGNDRKGGENFALMTVNRNPGEFDPSATTYKLPKDASTAFKDGYYSTWQKFSLAQGVQIFQNLAQARIAKGSSRGSGGGFRPQIVASGGRRGGEVPNASQPVAVSGQTPGNKTTGSANASTPVPKNLKSVTITPPSRQLKAGGEGQSVVNVPTPAGRIASISTPTEILGSGQINDIWQHPTNKNFVVKMMRPELAARMNDPQVELRNLNSELRTLKWLKQAGVPVIKPVGLVKVGNRYGMVLPKVTGALFSKDIKPASNAAWSRLVKAHGADMIEQINKIDRTYKESGVNDLDFQFYITSNGKVVVSDPGHVSQWPAMTNQATITQKWVDRIKEDMQRQSTGQPVQGPPMRTE